MKKLIILSMVLLVLVSNTFAQKVDVKDTIKVAVLQNFDAPSVGALVFANVLKLDISAELLDGGMKKIRDIKKITQKPKKEDLAIATKGGRGTTVWAVLSDMVEQPGTYYVKVGINMSGEIGSVKADVYYMVIAYNPTLAAPVKLRDKYFYGEKETFSFATVDYPDPNAYSYEITDGGKTPIVQGHGSVVKLDSVFNMVSNCGKKLSVKGLYQGKEFTYLDPSTKKTMQSVWECSLMQPTISQFTTWKQDKPDENYYLSVDNDMAKQVFFIYTGDTPGGFAVTVPELQNLRVVSEPENFIASATARKAKPFTIVDMKFNEEFLANMKIGDSENIKLTVSFRTQFGEQIRKEFYAVVIK